MRSRKLISRVVLLRKVTPLDSNATQDNNTSDAFEICPRSHFDRRQNKLSGRCPAAIHVLRSNNQLATFRIWREKS